MDTLHSTEGNVLLGSIKSAGANTYYRIWESRAVKATGDSGGQAKRRGEQKLEKERVLHTMGGEELCPFGMVGTC